MSHWSATVTRASTRKDINRSRVKPTISSVSKPAEAPSDAKRQVWLESGNPFCCPCRTSSLTEITGNSRKHSKIAAVIPRSIVSLIVPRRTPRQVVPSRVSAAIAQTIFDKSSTNQFYGNRRTPGSAGREEDITQPRLERQRPDRSHRLLGGR